MFLSFTLCSLAIDPQPPSPQVSGLGQAYWTRSKTTPWVVALYKSVPMNSGSEWLTQWGTFCWPYFQIHKLSLPSRFPGWESNSTPELTFAFPGVGQAGSTFWECVGDPLQTLSTGFAVGESNPFSPLKDKVEIQALQQTALFQEVSLSNSLLFHI